MYIVTVSFTVYENQIEQFIALMNENARLSTSLEPGCRQFQFSQATDSSRDFFVYEAYENIEAFQSHIAMPHVMRIAPALAPMIQAKSARKYEGFYVTYVRQQTGGSSVVSNN